MSLKCILPIVLAVLFLSCKTHDVIDLNKNGVPISKWIKPPNLKVGDTIAVVSPASFLKNNIQSIKNGLDSIKAWGLNYKLYNHVFDVNGHFAGTDNDRISDFQNAINNPNMKAIWCARGGYGSVRIVDKLNFSSLKQNPKWIIGYSDITVIHNVLHNNEIQTVHGLVLTSFNNTSSETVDAIKTLKNVLFGTRNSYKIKSSLYNKYGESSGVLVGGNLSLLQSMLESESTLNTKGKILFIEDVGEKKYNIDRMLYSLKRAGYFKDCRGLIVGGFTDVKENTPLFGKKVEEIILELVAEYDFPVLFDFPAGHFADNRTLIFGASVKLKVEKEYSFLDF